MADRDAYEIRRLLAGAFRALPEPPTNCGHCGWPTGGAGRYQCLCAPTEGDET